MTTNDDRAPIKNLDEAIATYQLMLLDGDVEPLDALRSVQEDCDEATAADLEVAVSK